MRLFPWRRPALPQPCHRGPASETSAWRGPGAAERGCNASSRCWEGELLSGKPLRRVGLPGVRLFPEPAGPSSCPSGLWASPSRLPFGTGAERS